MEAKAFKKKGPNNEGNRGKEQQCGERKVKTNFLFGFGSQDQNWPDGKGPAQNERKINR